MPLEHRNILIASLGFDAREQLLAKSVEVVLPVRTVLYDAHEAPAFAYFLTSGLASIVALTVEGGTAEVGVMGREGVSGTLQLLGPLQAPTRCFMQMEGTAVRLPAAELRRIFFSVDEVRAAVLRQVQEQALTTSQIAGCHRLHEAEQRLARWLLMVQDRTQGDVMNLTQEYVAEMLGTRRTTVTMVAGELQRRGLIQYQRGRVRILDRKGMEAAACDCYRITREFYLRTYEAVAEAV